MTTTDTLKKLITVFWTVITAKLAFSYSVNTDLPSNAWHMLQQQLFQPGTLLTIGSYLLLFAVGTLLIWKNKRQGRYFFLLGAAAYLCANIVAGYYIQSNVIALTTDVLTVLIGLISALCFCQPLASQNQQSTVKAYSIAYYILIGLYVVTNIAAIVYSGMDLKFLTPAQQAIYKQIYSVNNPYQGFIDPILLVSTITTVLIPILLAFRTNLGRLLLIIYPLFFLMDLLMGPDMSTARFSLCSDCGNIITGALIALAFSQPLSKALFKQPLSNAIKNSVKPFFVIGKDFIRTIYSDQACRDMLTNIKGFPWALIVMLSFILTIGNMVGVYIRVGHITNLWLHAILRLIFMSIMLTMYVLLKTTILKNRKKLLFRTVNNNAYSLSFSFVARVVAVMLTPFILITVIVVTSTKALHVPYSLLVTMIVLIAVYYVYSMVRINKLISSDLAAY